MPQEIQFVRIERETLQELGKDLRRDCTLHETSSVISSNICARPSKSKSLEDIKTDNFLDAQNKKEVSDMMRKKNREEKLLRGNEAPTSQTQETHNTSSVMSTPLISSEVSLSDGDNSSEIVEYLDSMTVKKLWDKNQDKSQNKTPQSHKKKGTENITQVIADVMQDKNLTDSTHATDAEYSAIKANQEETLCWTNYGKEFIIQYNDLVKNSNGKIGEKKVKGIIYDKILEHLIIIREKDNKNESEAHILPINENASLNSRLPISALPDDPEEKRKYVIEMVLDRFSCLSFNLVIKTCPVCNQKHKRDDIKGEWGDGDYYGEKTYRLTCWGMNIKIQSK
ncbi:38768_t:CDS:2, partial [Gigaspora margarita]